MSMRDRKSTRLNSCHTVIYTLSLHDALPIFLTFSTTPENQYLMLIKRVADFLLAAALVIVLYEHERSEEHTSELLSHSDLHSFPTRRSSDLPHLLNDAGKPIPHAHQARGRFSAGGSLSHCAL